MGAGLHVCVHGPLHECVNDPMDGSTPGSSTHGILKARILEWAAVYFSTHTYERVHMHMCLCVCTCMYVYIYVCVCAHFTGVPRLLSLLRSSPGLCSHPVCDDKRLYRESTTCSKGLFPSLWLSQRFCINCVAPHFRLHFSGRETLLEKKKSSSQTRPSIACILTQ